MKRNKHDNKTALEQVFAYHQATKHHFNAYANGPSNLDWANQANPFRRYQGARLITLANDLPVGEVRYDDVFVSGRLSPAPVNAHSISQLFYDSLTVSAWKSSGSSRWALRVNPSSGNLHPTEAYLLCGPVDGLSEQAMVCHYAPQEHALEVRAELDAGLWSGLTADFPENTLYIGLTSIHWREEWKYGQRAYRYCQHDVGHAVAAICMAAAGLGWQATLLDDLSADELALLMGTACDDDAEREVPDLLMAISPIRFNAVDVALSVEHVALFASLHWQGRANRLSAAHIDWGVEEVAKTTQKPPGRILYEAYDSHLFDRSLAGRAAGHAVDISDGRACLLRDIVRQRRSAVAMDGTTRISRDTFFHMLEKTVMLQSPPLNVLPWQPKIHLVLFVHRVDDLPCGIYILVREPTQLNTLKSALTQVDEWHRVEACPDHLMLYRLFESDVREASRQISCFQDIASDSCFSLAMIAEYEAPLQHFGPWFYPRLFWEAGIIGQLLYLEAEAAGIRSTGIGCFFDDAMHEVLGLKGTQYQDLYHFTVGGPVADVRLTTLSTDS